MNITGTIRLFSVFVALMVFLAGVSSAPASYPTEYDNNLRELLEMLIQKDNSVEDRLGLHQMVRKASRSPQLRLRFGKRPDTTFPVPAYLAGLNEAEN
ncbi:short neuropeptide F-like [Cylas formicarius]|uniref:short neuropeptide F-like n=1 Tax=Cylas formicarius TaxID=197179 RepID=UPI0029589D64|nr:short neuropeptide F-like [Cylas formicarius]XP_060526830.1 short neuropeptide F-like [Cylas formicarius]